MANEDLELEIKFSIDAKHNPTLQSMLSDVKKTLNKKKSKKKKEKKVSVSKQAFRKLNSDEERSLFKKISFPLVP